MFHETIQFFCSMLNEISTPEILLSTSQFLKPLEKLLSYFPEHINQVELAILNGTEMQTSANTVSSPNSKIRSIIQILKVLMGVFIRDGNHLMTLLWARNESETFSSSTNINNGSSDPQSTLSSSTHKPQIPNSFPIFEIALNIMTTTGQSGITVRSLILQLLSFNPSKCLADVYGQLIAYVLHYSHFHQILVSIYWFPMRCNC
jgi:hypothetical protein